MSDLDVRKQWKQYNSADESHSIVSIVSFEVTMVCLRKQWKDKENTNLGQFKIKW